MSRRAEIVLTEAEQLELLRSERVVVVSTNGPRGWPHSMPMWFVWRDGEIWIWTYAKSQKVRNLERDPRATLLVETGTEYVTYVVPGVILLCVGFGAATTAVSVSHDMTGPIVDRLRALDVGGPAILGGHVAASVARNAAT